MKIPPGKGYRTYLLVGFLALLIVGAGVLFTLLFKASPDTALVTVTGGLTTLGTGTAIVRGQVDKKQQTGQ